MPTSAAWTRARLAVERERRRRAAEAEQAPPPIWLPNPDRDGRPNPQRLAYESAADITGYGGSAGSGKSDLMLGIAATTQRDSILFRRVHPNLRGLIKRSRQLFAGRGRFTGHDKTWRLDDGRTLEFGSMQHEEDKEKYQGRPHDFIGFDELTEFSEAQFRFVLAWLRTTIPGQRCRVVATFNPPHTAEGRWVTRFFGVWVDREHPNPARPGEVRWYATVDGQEIERPDGRPFEHTSDDGRTEVVQPLSRTFIPARLVDNPYQDTPAYRATLQSLPEPLRSMFLHGDFAAGVRDDPWQAIPTAWVQAAQKRWDAIESPPVRMTCVGMDVAHGGADQTVLAPRFGPYFGRLARFKGVDTPDGKSAAAECMRVVEDGAFVNVDAIGYGASAAERLMDKPPEGYGIKAFPINVAERSEFTDRSKKYRMVNVRAEMYWRLREALDPEGDQEIALPPDSELLADLCAPKYQVTTSGIKIESKDDIRGRLGRSPDCGDAVALAMIPDRTPAPGSVRIGPARPPVPPPTPGMSNAGVAGYPGGTHPAPSYPGQPPTPRLPGVPRPGPGGYPGVPRQPGMPGRR